MILMNDFVREYKTLQKEIDATAKKVFKSGWYILGNEVLSFEQAFANYCGAKYCIGTGNGAQSLEIALRASGIGPGDEVITTALSAVETAFAISATGATPVFADIDEYYHMDPNDVARKITKHTKAILPVHLYGQAVEIDSLVSLCKKHNLLLIEDACQGHGAKYKGKHVGTQGLAGCFSFYPTKNLGAYGDGGAIITNDEELYRKCLLYRNAGRTAKYTHIVKGLNSRLDELQAALLSVKLKLLDEFVAKRRERANWYLTSLKGIEGLDLPKERRLAQHSYHLFIIRSDSRDELQEYLKANDIESLVHYPTPIPSQPCYKNLSAVVPNTEKAVKEVLSLPIHPLLTRKEVQKICMTIHKFYSI